MAKPPVSVAAWQAGLADADPAAALTSALNGRDKSLKRVSDVLAPLNHSQKLQLYKMIRDGNLDDMAEPVAKLLVRMLNGRRSEHARRLWTGWFDAIILRNDALLKSEVRLAGALHLMDVSAWWFGLAGRMEVQVQRIQEIVAKLSQDLPLNDIFASAEAQNWAEELRERSIAILGRVRANPSEGTQLLGEVTGFRAQLLKSYGIRQRDSVPRSDIERFETILKAAPAWHGYAVPSLHRGDPVRIAQDMMQRGDCGQDGAAVFAVAGLHRRDDPELAARLHQAFPVPLVQDAIIGRLQVAAETLKTTLTGAFLNKPGLAIAGTAADGDHPLAQLKHFFAWYDVIQALELGTADRDRAAIHQAFRELGNTVHDELGPVLSRRIAALTMHSVLEPLIERVRFVNEFQAQMARRGIVSSGKPWRAEEAAQVAAVFRQIASTGSAEGLKMLSQLVDLAEMLSFPIEITALDIALVGVVEAALRGDERTFDASETRLIDRVIEVSSDEKRRCRWWVAPEMVTLLETVEKAGMQSKTKK